MKEELPNPLYLNFHNVTSVLKISAPKYQEVGVPYFPFIFLDCFCIEESWIQDFTMSL